MPDVTMPDPTEYAPFYAGYVERLPAGPIVPFLERQASRLRAWASHVPPALQDHRYAEEKWSVRQLVGHLADAERIFGTRALRIARGDTTPLPGFEENAYVRAAAFERRAWPSLVGELGALREANLHLFRTFGEAEWCRVGTVDGGAASVRAVVRVIAGHAEHHLGVLRERYGLSA